MKPLVIFGTGGFAREVQDVLRDINAATPQWDVLGFLDDQEENWGQTLNDLPVLGGREWLHAASEPPYLVIGIGNPVSKRRLARSLHPFTPGFPTLIHPTAVISPYTQIGQGVVITAGNIITNQITLDDFVMLNLMCTVGHDCYLGKYVSVSPGVNISGNVSIGEGCDIGTGTKIIQGISIQPWSIIGAGAVVTKDLPANCTAVGTPAKVIKERDADWHL